MNGAHDLGGKHGFEPVDHTVQETFETNWEREVFAITLACGFLGKWNLDESRFAREQMEPGEYLNSSYYEHWLHGLETLLVEKNLVTAGELATGVSNADATADHGIQAVTAENAAKILAVGGPTLMDTDRSARFLIGDTVVVRHQNHPLHTRAPGYVQGRKGIIVENRGAHIFPDVHSRNGNKAPEYLYTVRFASADLWAAETDIETDTQGIAQSPGRQNVYVDLFEPYLLTVDEFARELGLVTGHRSGGESRDEAT